MKGPATSSCGLRRCSAPFSGPQLSRYGRLGPRVGLASAGSAGPSGGATIPDCVFSREEEDDGCYDGPEGVLQQPTPSSTSAPSATPVNPLNAAAAASAAGAGAGARAGMPRVTLVNAASVLTATAPTQSGTVPEEPTQPLEATSSGAGAERERFDWFAQWWPVAPVELMDASRPHPFTLLGQDLVLWRDGSGQWRAFRDACPHRMAPLSEGRIEKDGQLLCAYHGWRFDGKGACTEIPTARTPDQLHRATSSPRSCATAHPTLQRGGLLWVWGQGGPGAEEAAAAKQPYLPPEIQADGSGAPGVEAPGWTFRDLPYGHNYFIENVVDPAHVPVSHHKVAGNRYTDPKPFGMEFSRPLSLEGGFEFRIPDPWRADVAESFTGFQPPAHVRIQQNHTKGGSTILALFSTPTRPGWTRHIGQQLRVGGGTGIAFFAAPLPKWLFHSLGSVFLHQDMVFLHHQERIVAREAAARREEGAGAGATSPSPSSPSAPVPPPKYFMPTGVDRGVTAWRSWLSTFAGGDVQWAPGTPPLGPRETDPTVLFDTYHTHTKQCVVCSAALARMRTVRSVARAVGLLAAALAVAAVAVRAMAAVAAAAAATAAATATVPQGVLGTVVKGAAGFFATGEGVFVAMLAIVAALVVAATNKLERMMHIYEYSHRDNH
ncbi:hypothetical protein HYH03_016491 [Edaphochlamys debaryana]|uniref:Rieske domain-containing protein n=1 Tax=Edaphochlamys debaryana TaxID=47281 RepID=A0A835XRJ7_9CHLO|nr:hypothetical protein HYH03_016491 [Edaphochlamys debaryana]|eukprot:KAG2484744.1 hypothetical protein HYH03_016491 [Edaphochlamys debaryana]